MRRILLLCMPLATVLPAQSVIDAWPGSPLVDGIISTGEWSAAPFITIGTAPGDTCHVAVQADGQSVYFAFMGDLESANVLFPEVLIDVDHDRTPAWNADDHWFHVSATDCHHQGAYAVYDDCLLVQPDWTGAPNILPGAPISDTVEIEVPWNKLGLVPQEGDTLGLCLLLTNTASLWRTWPSGASRLAPDTWGELVLPFLNGMGENGARRTFEAWPNPANDVLHLQGDASRSGMVDIRLLDAQGRVVRAKSSVLPAEIAVEALPPGLYQCVIHMPDGTHRTRNIAVVR
jgi:hypothetical protein